MRRKDNDLGKKMKGKNQEDSNQENYDDDLFRKEQNPKKNKVETVMTYSAEKVIGNGSFGVVYQARVQETGEVVALKKVFQDKRYKNRELSIMKELSHPNIVKLKHHFFSNGDKEDEVFLNIVMEFVPENAYKFMKKYFKLKHDIPLIFIKLYAYQISRSLLHLNALGICHRDIKPQNLLIDSKTHIIVLCDFGSAKKLVKGEPNVSYICSRYYRAPELIFGCSDYSTQIDMWSLGCVIAEFMLGQPIFPGESGVDQLVEIIKVLGTPNKEQILAMNPNYNEFKFPIIPKKPWEKVFKPTTQKLALDFISNVLVYDPKQRLNALKALAHPFFDELRDQRTKLPNGDPLPNLFNFTKEELSKMTEEYREKLIPKWYHGVK